MLKKVNKIVLHMGAFVLSASILTAGSVMTINAAGNDPFTFKPDTSGKEHCSQLASTGTIKDGTSGKVLFKSSDITTLAEGVNTANDRITAEEGQAKSFKDGISESLQHIGSTPSSGTYGYYSPSNLTGDSDLGNFQNVINGSQAITGYPTGTKDADGNETTLNNMQATDKDGNLLYYTDDTKDLTKTTTDTSKITLGTNTDGTTKTADDYKVYYKPASAANLTAGSAAWVDGSLIKGNGQDNTTLYNNGYVAGMQHQTNGNIVYTLVHQHTGSSTSGGGCYTVQKSSQRQVTETVWKPIPWNNGHGMSGVGVYTTETKTVTDYWYELGCNHKDGDFIRTTSDYNSIQPNERIQKAEITY